MWTYNLRFQTYESYKLRKNNHCLRNNNCYYNVFGTMRQTSKNKNCKCDGKYSYKCEDYCTIDNKYTVI